MTWKKKVWVLMEEPSLNPVSEIAHYIYSCIILGSVLSMVIGTIKNNSGDKVLVALEVTFNLMFTLEACIRVFCAPQKKALARNMYMWMDIMAVLPFWIVLIFGLDV